MLFIMINKSHRKMLNNKGPKDKPGGLQIKFPPKY